MSSTSITFEFERLNFFDKFLFVLFLYLPCPASSLDSVRRFRCIDSCDATGNKKGELRQIEINKFVQFNRLKMQGKEMI